MNRIASPTLSLGATHRSIDTETQGPRVSISSIPYRRDHPTAVSHTDRRAQSNVHQHRDTSHSLSNLCANDMNVRTVTLPPCIYNSFTTIRVHGPHLRPWGFE